MRKTLDMVLVLLVASLLAAPGFAHGGKNHRLMGTVKEVQAANLVVTSTDGHEVTVALTDQTKYEQAGKTASKSNLAVGVRVSIQLAEDDKAAVVVKMAPAHKEH